MLKKNEIYEAEITGMTSEGSGVARIEGMAVFVPLTAVGDRLRVRIVKVLKHYAFGIIDTLLEPSKDRKETDCPVFRQCGGCVFRHIRYEAQLRYKEQAVQDAFTRIGGLSPEFEPILGAAEQDGYRNKAQYPIAKQDGKLVCGFYAKHSHRVIPQLDCALQPAVFSEILQFLLPLLDEAEVSAYDEQQGTGLLRHIYLRRGYHSEEIMLCFVVRKSIRRKLGRVIPAVTARFPQIVSITENINPERTNVILGSRTETLHGAPVLKDTMCGNSITISPESFYQVNTAQAEQLYAIAKEYAQLTGREVLLDLYCGAGTIGLSMADSAASVIGAEIVPEAVENAAENARRSGIDNAQFFCGDAGNVAQQLHRDGIRPDVIVLDPPRKGCDTATLDAVTAMQPERIVMISCNPATAARDAAILTEKGYRLEKVRPVDLFPHTAHCEVVASFSKNL